MQGPQDCLHGRWRHTSTSPNHRLPLRAFFCAALHEVEECCKVKFGQRHDYPEPLMMLKDPKTSSTFGERAGLESKVKSKFASFARLCSF